MTFSSVLKWYEGIARKLAIQAGSRVDAWMGARRHIRTENSNFILGAEAIPAPIRGFPGNRR